MSEYDPSEAEESRAEYDYIHMLNRSLPPDIRMRAWTPVPKSFSARFSCISRTYRYYFFSQNLDLISMSEGAQHFIGVHDFKNFFRSHDNTNNFIRRIYEFELVHETASLPQLPTSTNQIIPNLVYFHVRANAFLYHQVRCMMAVLFLIGEGKEPPWIVRDLLDLKKRPQKLVYQAAFPNALCLWECAFLPSLSLKWRTSRYPTRRSKVKSAQFDHPLPAHFAFTLPLTPRLPSPRNHFQISYDESYLQLLHSLILPIRMIVDMEETFKHTIQEEKGQQKDTESGERGADLLKEKIG